MITHTAVFSHRKVYLEFFEKFRDKCLIESNGKKESTNHSTIREFINQVDNLTRAYKELPQIKLLSEDMSKSAENKYKGDFLEVLAEIYFTQYESSSTMGLTQYTVVPLDNDYGVDATGVTPAGQKVAVQVKYRSNPNDKIEYSELTNTYFAASELENIDVKRNNCIFLFTTSNKMTPVCEKMFAKKVVFINRDILSQNIDNNQTFWNRAYSLIKETLA